MKLPIILVLLVVLGIVALPLRGAAQLLILVNDANPSAVTFTATPLGLSVATDASNTVYDGIDLGVFFTAEYDGMLTNQVALGTPSLLPTSQTAPDGTNPGAVYNMYFFDDVSTQGSGPDTDLNIINNVDQNVGQSFTVGTQAFTGTTTFNLIDTAAELPTFGTTGFIYDGNTESVSATIIGTYLVVPEPSNVWLMLFGGIMLIAVLRLRVHS